MRVGEIFRKTGYDRAKWLALSKRIRSQRENTCAICRKTDDLTHLHHWCYKPGKQLHEYQDDELVLLCESCHSKMHRQMDIFRSRIFPKLNPRSFQVLNAALSIGLTKNDGLSLAYAICGLLESNETFKSLMEYGAREYGESLTDNQEKARPVTNDP